MKNGGPLNAYNQGPQSGPVIWALVICPETYRTNSGLNWPHGYPSMLMIKAESCLISQQSTPHSFDFVICLGCHINTRYRFLDGTVDKASVEGRKRETTFASDANWPGPEQVGIASPWSHRLWPENFDWLENSSSAIHSLVQHWNGEGLQALFILISSLSGVWDAMPKTMRHYEQFPRKNYYYYYFMYIY